MREKTTSGSLLNAREVVVVEIYLQLAFAHEGSGRCRNGGKAIVVNVQLAFACEGRLRGA
jgi:hypothetical protein